LKDGCFYRLEYIIMSKMVLRAGDENQRVTSIDSGLRPAQNVYEGFL
jgi:hypothetical protein